MEKRKLGELRDVWALFIAQWPFEWWVTLTFENTVNQEIARKKLNIWTRKICKQEELQLAYFAVFNELKRGHLHLLMLGKNRNGKALKDVSKKRWTEEWVDGNAEIKKVFNLMGVSSYLSQNLTLNNPNLSNIYSYNQRLLKKYKLASIC
jgi:hypothetical protein